MKKWIGRYLIAIGVFHALLTFVFFQDGLISIFQEGIWNTVSGHEDRTAAFWFMMSGFFSIVLGIFVNCAEHELSNLPVSLGYSLLTLAAVIVIVLPAIGGWLLFPPGIALVIRNRKDN